MSTFQSIPTFEDPRVEGVIGTLGDHVEADLSGARNPVDEPDYLAVLLRAVVEILTPDQQRLIANRLHFTEKTERE